MTTRDLAALVTAILLTHRGMPVTINDDAIAIAMDKAQRIIRRADAVT